MGLKDLTRFDPSTRLKKFPNPKNVPKNNEHKNNPPVGGAIPPCLTSTGKRLQRKYPAPQGAKKLSAAFLLVRVSKNLISAFLLVRTPLRSASNHAPYGHAHAHTGAAARPCARAEQFPRLACRCRCAAPPLPPATRVTPKTPPRVLTGGRDRGPSCKDVPAASSGCGATCGAATDRGASLGSGLGRCRHD